MGLEDLTGASKFIDDLINTNPDGSTDGKAAGDDHIRGIKNVLLNTFPNITGAITSTQAELNILDGATLSTVELNILAGLGTTQAELGYLDLATGPGTQEASKAVVADSNVNTGVSKVTQLHVGASGSEVQMTSSKVNNAPVIRDASGAAALDVTGNVAGEVAPTTMVATSWPSFRAYLSADQTGITGSEVLGFDTETFDTNSDFTSSRFTPTVAGKYLLTSQAMWLNTVIGDTLYLNIAKNGTAVSQSRVTADDIIETQNITDVVDANGTTDYFEIIVLNSDRDTSDINDLIGTFFSGCRIG